MVTLNERFVQQHIAQHSGRSNLEDAYGELRDNAVGIRKGGGGGESGRVRHGHITLLTTDVLLPEEYPAYPTVEVWVA